MGIFCFAGFILLFFKDFIYLFLKRGEGREKKRKRNVDLVHTLTRDPTHNPGPCPDRELNQGPVSLQDDAQTTELHQSGWLRSILCCVCQRASLAASGRKLGARGQAWERDL